jgi:hypothetical protein
VRYRDKYAGYKDDEHNNEAPHESLGEECHSEHVVVNALHLSQVAEHLDGNFVRFFHVLLVGILHKLCSIS